MRLLRWCFLLLCLLLVGTVTLWESERRVSPGPLHPLHAASAELAGNGGCRGCHGDGGAAAVAAAACGRCHAAVAGQLQQRSGLHGSLDPARAADCGRCHREHHGSELALLDDRAFQLAGVADASAYDHRFTVGFPLHGRHDGLACARCHEGADAAAPPAGGRFLGRSSRCAACHDDVHRGGYGDDCASCHGQQQPFDRAASFRHTDAFALQQAHAGHRCVDCHATGSERSVEALRQQPLPGRRCADCHANPHGAAGATKPAMAIADAGDCSRCHDATKFADHRVDRQMHGQLGYPLAGLHGELACRSCHGDGGRTPRWRGPAPTPARCAACHESPHQPAFLAASQRGEPIDDCAGCHGEPQRVFAQGVLTAAQHAATGMPLLPPHDRLACDQCHGDAAGRPFAERFPGRAAADCRACHRDVHSGQFDRGAGKPACTACHQPTQWTPPSYGLEAHQQGSFPLLGQHQAVACSSCHRPREDGVRAFAGTSQLCSQCHRDPHRGAFDQPGLPAQVEGRSGCARCHDEQGFRPVRKDFDHGRWTGFPLRDKHAALQCAQCHARGQGPRLGRALGDRCADCHRDVHQGQFRNDGRVDCQRCHDEGGFQQLRFDHQRDARFALDRTHAALACGRCHLAVASPDGPVVRYRPLGIECKDCHVQQRKEGR